MKKLPIHLLMLAGCLTAQIAQAGFQGTWLDINGTTVQVTNTGTEWASPYTYSNYPSPGRSPFQTIDVTDTQVRYGFGLPCVGDPFCESSFHFGSSYQERIRYSYIGLFDRISSVSLVSSSFVGLFDTSQQRLSFGSDFITLDLSGLSYDNTQPLPSVVLDVKFNTLGPLYPIRIDPKVAKDYIYLYGSQYVFSMIVDGEKRYYLDPPVSIGYDYAIGAGDPNFRSVILPADIGDGEYVISGFDRFGAPVNDIVHGGDIYDFGLAGVSEFRVTGIEPAAGLDPNDPNAFLTGLTFTGPGTFTGTMTPLMENTQSDVPEPASISLIGIALAFLGWSRQRKAVQ